MGFAESVADLPLVGGAMCLDFVNTVDPRFGPRPPREYLTDYAALLTWCCRAKAITDVTARRLGRLARMQPSEAARAVRQARLHRELLHPIFQAISHGGPPMPGDLDRLHAWTCAVQRACRPRWTGSELTIEPVFETLDSVLAPVALSATTLLTGPTVWNVRECPGAGDCGWLFLDTTKNHSRIWCRSDGCGARVKMRRRYWDQRPVTVC